MEQPMGSKEIEGAWRFQCMGRCATVNPALHSDLTRSHLRMQMNTQSARLPAPPRRSAPTRRASIACVLSRPHSERELLREHVRLQLQPAGVAANGAGLPLHLQVLRVGAGPHDEELLQDAGEHERGRWGWGRGEQGEHSARLPGLPPERGRVKYEQQVQSGLPAHAQRRPRDGCVSAIKWRDGMGIRGRTQRIRSHTLPPCALLHRACNQTCPCCPFLTSPTFPRCKRITSAAHPAPVPPLCVPPTATPRR